MHLLFLGIALKFDDLHTVAQRLRNRIQHIRRRDKQHLRQIKSYIEVIIAEAGVLLGIERFQQCGSRISAEVTSNFVDLIQHENRILGLGTTDPLNDLPRQSPDISAAMTADFGFIMYAA